MGGTFTDAALLTDQGLVTAKAPTTPDDQSRGVLAAIDAVCEQAQTPRDRIRRFVHGMTVATNALLEDAVAPTALLATEGFTDIEELGRQARADLYRLCAGHPPPLVPAHRRIAVGERTTASGIVRALDTDRLASCLQPLDEVEACAICFLWGFRYPEHERKAAELVATHRPELHISTSHEAAGVVREYERCATTVVDAALSPLIRSYLTRLGERSAGAGLCEPEVMLSGGGVVDAATAARHGAWAVLSGPAAGAVGAAWMAQRAGEPGVVCLDMGGTSCDVCLASEGRVHEVGERKVAGRALALPMVDVHTVGAGGGSIAWRDAGGALRVGPHSAGADPGPACYGLEGTEPTVTDASLLLGYLDADSALAGGIELDRKAAQRAIAGLARELELSVEDAAWGIFRVASAEMARAVRVTTVERGIDPRGLTLLAFGGAGPAHATAIADELGMRRVLVPRSSGVLSALGLCVSERRRDFVKSVLLSGPELTRQAIDETVEALAARGRRELQSPDAEVRAGYDLRYAGQSFELTISGDAGSDPSALREAFDAAHERRYGYSDGDAVLELVTIRVAVALPGTQPARLSPVPVSSQARRSVRFASARCEATVFAGQPPDFSGPAVVELGESTLVVPPGWKATTGAEATIALERQ